MPRIRRSTVPHVAQLERSDCGAATLLAVLRHYGGDQTLEDVRRTCRTDSMGTTMLELRNAARSLGFAAEGARGTLDALGGEQLPAIAAGTTDGFPHYVVVWEIKSSKVLVGDPAGSVGWWSVPEFERFWDTRAVLLLRPEAVVRSPRASRPFAALKAVMMDQREWLTQSVFTAALVSAFGLVAVTAVQRAVDSVVRERTPAALGVAVAVLVGSQALRVGIGYVRLLVLSELSRRLRTGIVEHSVRVLARVRAQFGDSRPVADVAARLLDGISVQGFVLQAIGGGLLDVVIGVGGLILAASYSPTVAGWAALALLLALKPVWTRVARAQRSQVQVADRDTVLKQRLHETAHAVTMSRSRSVGRYLVDRAVGAAADVGNAATSANRQMATAVLVMDLAGAVVLSGAIGVLSLSALAGDLTAGELVGAYTALSFAIPAFARVAELAASSRAMSIQMQRLDALLVEDRHSHDSEGRPVLSSEGLMVMGASFSWPRQFPGVASLTFSVRPGEALALVGPNGCGKSTMAQLLTGRVAPQSGRVTLGGITLAAIAEDQRAEVATLAPDVPVILSGTVRDNITLGADGLRDSEVMALATALGVRPLLDAGGLSLDTPIGESVRRLSSGERQVLGLLRAVLPSPPLLVLDEALSALDGALAAHILKSLLRMRRDHITIVISHEKSQQMECDARIVWQSDCGDPQIRGRWCLSPSPTLVDPPLTYTEVS